MPQYRVECRNCLEVWWTDYEENSDTAMASALAKHTPPDHTPDIELIRGG